MHQTKQGNLLALSLCIHLKKYLENQALYLKIKANSLNLKDDVQWAKNNIMILKEILQT